MSEATCPKDAAVRYIWPGKDEDFCCTEHAIGINNVANAMGFSVHMRPITDDVVKGEWPKCSSCIEGST